MSMKLIERVAPAEIEKRSFEIITEELLQRGIALQEDRAFVILRAIHTTADLDYAETLYFSEGAVETGRELLKNGAAVVTDTNMALAGINKKRLAAFGGEAVCRMADADVAEEAKRRGITRAAVSMERAADEAIRTGRKTLFAIGNAPTALLALREMIDRQYYFPDMIIGVPVGFVNVEAAKEAVMETDVPCIVNRGRKGGSNVAAAVVNALLYSLGNKETE